MTPQQIEIAAVKAGFTRTPLADPVRLIFSRGPNLLNVHTDGKWAFYTEIVDGKKPDRYGTDFQSLETFFSS